MSTIINLITLADSAARSVCGTNLPQTSLHVDNDNHPQVAVSLLDVDRFPERGEVGDRVRINHTSGLAWLRVTGDAGEDPETLLHEAIDYLTEQPTRLAETEVPL